jgi:hypothetical protein
VIYPQCAGSESLSITWIAGSGFGVGRGVHLFAVLKSWCRGRVGLGWSAVTVALRARKKVLKRIVNIIFGKIGSKALKFGKRRERIKKRDERC